MVKNKSLLTSALALLVFSPLLTGCYGQKMQNHIKEDVDTKFEDITSKIDQAKLPAEAVDTDTVSETNDLFLGEDSVIMASGSPLPKELETDTGVTFSSKDPVDIFSVASKLYYLTGISVKLDGLDQSLKDQKFRLSYTGSLSGLLNILSNEIGVSWDYNTREITLYKRKTKVFTLYALSTDSTFSTSVASNGSATGSSASVSATSSFDAWGEISKGIDDILKASNDDKASVNVSKSTGTISITATPSVLKQAGDFIRIQNERFSRQVVVSVKIMQVSLSDADSIGIDLNAVINNGSKIALGLASGTANSTTVSGGTGISYAIAAGSGNKYAGSNDIIKALSQQGKTSLLTSAVLTTINNKVVPFNNLKTYKYISQISNTINDGAVSSDVQTDSITEGFSMQLLPNILDNGRMLMMFNMSYKELVSLDTINTSSGQTVSSGSSSSTSGGSSGSGGSGSGTSGTTNDSSQVIQIPTIEERSFLQELVLKSGQTVVLTGFEKTKNQSNKAGVGSPNFMLAGGSRALTVSRDVLVVIITPQIINSPLHPSNRAAEGTFLK